MTDTPPAYLSAQRTIDLSGSVVRAWSNSFRPQPSEQHYRPGIFGLWILYKNISATASVMRNQSETLTCWVDRSSL